MEEQNFQPGEKYFGTSAQGIILERKIFVGPEYAYA